MEATSPATYARKSETMTRSTERPTMGTCTLSSPSTETTVAAPPSAGVKRWLPAEVSRSG